MPENGRGTLSIRAEGVTFNDFRFNITLYEGVFSELVSTPVTAVKTVGKNLAHPTKTEGTSEGITYKVMEDGGIHAHGTATGYSNFYLSDYYGKQLPSGYTYYYSGTKNIGQPINLYVARMKPTSTSPYWVIDSDRPDKGYVSSPFTAETDRRYRIYLQVTPGKTVDVVVYPMLEQGSSATAFAPYTERTYPIPEAVQNLEGYGLGISDTLYNYVDFENETFVRNCTALTLNGTENWSESAASIFSLKLESPSLPSSTVLSDSMQEFRISGNGQYLIAYTSYSTIDEWKSSLVNKPINIVLSLAVKETEDISQRLEFDGFVKVEGNGWIFFVNESKSAVPYSITYQKTKGA